MVFLYYGQWFMASQEAIAATKQVSLNSAEYLEGRTTMLFWRGISYGVSVIVLCLWTMGSISAFMRSRFNKNVNNTPISDQ
jgi:hypothetical protein